MGIYQKMKDWYTGSENQQQIEFPNIDINNPKQLEQFISASNDLIVINKKENPYKAQATWREPKDPSKRETLKKLAAIGLEVLLIGGGLGLAKRASAFEEKYLTDENTFKDEIAKSGTTWVKYEIDNPKRSNMPHEELKKLGNNFWDILKKEFGNQVDSYIVVNATGWSNRGEAAVREINKDKYPSFLLYKNGVIVNDKTEKDIRIRGGIRPSKITGALNYIRKNSFLN